MLNLTCDQLSAAGAFLERQCIHGCRVEAIDIMEYTRTVAIFRVVAPDGSRFGLAIDKWGNRRLLPKDYADEMTVLRDMHVRATES